MTGGIATYSQAGAQFSFNMLWTIIVTYPQMVVIQVISAWLGRVSGHGLATNIRRRYPAWLLYGSVFLLLVAIAADPPAMGAAGQSCHWRFRAAQYHRLGTVFRSAASCRLQPGRVHARL